MVSQGAFGVPYSVCGCCPDPDVLPQGAAKLRLPEDQLAPLVNLRPDLVSMEDEDADASHPSEHNAAVGDPNSRATRHAFNKRTAKTEGRLNRAKKRPRTLSVTPGCNSRRRETPSGKDTGKHLQTLCSALLHIIPTGALHCFRHTGQLESLDRNRQSLVLTRSP
jgi:hypothetical protein